MVAVLYSYMVDDGTSALRPRAQARLDIDALLDGGDPYGLSGDGDEMRAPIGEWGHTSGIPTTQPVGRAAYPDRETWGLLPDHVAGLERAMTIVGGDG